MSVNFAKKFFRDKSVEVEQPLMSKQNLVVASILLIFGAGVVAISQLFLINQSLRLDEAQSIFQTSHSLKGLLEVVAQDVHMPGYHILLHYWILLFGNSVEAVRSLSLMFFLMTIPVVYLLARTVMCRGWSLFFVALFSFSPFMNWYANEARMYTLLVLFSALNQYYFVRILQKGKGWIGYAATAVLGAYSHYFFLFNLIVQGIFYLSNHRQFVKGSFKKFIGVAFLLIAAIAPWITYFISQGAASNTRPLIEEPTTVNFFNAFSQFMFGFQNDAVNTVLVSSWPLLVVVAFFSVKRNLSFNYTVGYLMAAAIAPVLIAFSLSYITNPFFLSRYMASVVAPLFIVFVWFISRFQLKYSLPVAGLSLLILGLNFSQQITSYSTPVKEDYKGVVQDITRDVKPQDVIVVSSPFTSYPFDYYYNGPAQIRTLPLWNRVEVGSIPAFDPNKLPAQVKTLADGHEYIYLVLSYDQGYEEQIWKYFENNFERTEFKRYSADVDLYVYKVGYNKQPAL